MKLLVFYLLIFAGLLGFTASLQGCNSPQRKALRVLGDQQAFAQVRDSVFARGLCLNDTVITSFSHDTVTIQQLPAAVDTLLVRTPEACAFDTIVNHVRVRLIAGKLYVTPPPTRVQLHTVTKRITNTVRDESREKVLKQQLSYQLTSAQAAREEAEKAGLKLKTQQAVAGSLRLKLYLALAAAGLLSFGLIKKSFF